MQVFPEQNLMKLYFKEVFLSIDLYLYASCAPYLFKRVDSRRNVYFAAQILSILNREKEHTHVLTNIQLIQVQYLFMMFCLYIKQDM